MRYKYLLIKPLESEPYYYSHLLFWWSILTIMALLFTLISHSFWPSVALSSYFAGYTMANYYTNMRMVKNL